MPLPATANVLSLHVVTPPQLAPGAHVWKEPLVPLGGAVVDDGAALDADDDPEVDDRVPESVRAPAS